MSFNSNKKTALAGKLVVGAAACYLLARPFIVAPPPVKPLVQVPKEQPAPVTKPVKKPWVETYVPKHNVKLPKFAQIKDVKEKKRQFFGFLKPHVAKANERMLNKRQWLEAVKLKLLDAQTLSQDTLTRLGGYYDEYRVERDSLSELEAVKALLNRVDEIPKELVLMQAANESAWGSSRFARLGLNFFGQWCFSPGCGIVPRGRPVGKTYEVKAFMTVQESVDGYFKNINTNEAYQLLRDIRAQLRANELPLDAQVLATGLLPYSQRGDHYVLEITQMIEHNQRYMMD